MEEVNHEVRFVQVEKKGKITLQAVVNNVKFYCNATFNDGQRKKFRCSYYDSERCKCSFFATQTQIKSEPVWEVENLENATNHYHEGAIVESMIDKAKAELKKAVLDAPIENRLKDVYFNFTAKYRKKLDNKEGQLFDQHFPTYRILRLTLWRWRTEVIPKAPMQQEDLDVTMKNFFNDAGEHLVLGDETDSFGKRTITLGAPSSMKSFSETSRMNIDCTYQVGELLKKVEIF